MLVPPTTLKDKDDDQTKRDAHNEAVQEVRTKPQPEPAIDELTLRTAIIVIQRSLTLLTLVRLRRVLRSANPCVRGAVGNSSGICDAGSHWTIPSVQTKSPSPGRQ